MNKKNHILRLLTILGFGLILAGSHYYAGYVGFKKGNSHGLWGASSGAFQTVNILKLIREERKEEAIKFLEIYLDNQIVNLGMSKNEYNHIFAPWWVSSDQKRKIIEDVYKALQTVVEYREKYPSKSSSHDEIHKIIEEKIKIK